MLPVVAELDAEEVRQDLLRRTLRYTVIQRVDYDTLDLARDHVMT